MCLDLGGFQRGGRKPVPQSLQGAEGRPLAVVRGESGACVFAAVRERLKGFVLGNGRRHLYHLSTPKPLILRILLFEKQSSKEVNGCHLWPFQTSLGISPLPK